MFSKRLFLGEILLKKALITEGQLKEALEIQKKTGEFLGSILLKKNIIKEEDLLEALSEQLGIPFVKGKDIKIEEELVEKLPKSLILEKRCFPLKLEADSLTLAVTNPLEAWTVSEVQQYFSGYTIKVVLISSQDMDRLVEFYRNYLKSKIKRQLGF